MSNTHYRYQDPGDSLTKQYTSKFGADWLNSEEVVLARVRDEVVSRFGKTSSFLDVGAGKGRLAAVFGGSVSRVVLVERDASRWDLETMRNAAVDGGYELDAVVCDGTELSAHINERFELVALNHVIQHVPTYKVDRIIDNACGRVCDGGTLMLSVSVSPSPEHDQYAKQMVDESGEIVEPLIERATFDELCETQSPGQLPIHRFAIVKIIEAIRRNSMRIDAITGFNLQGETRDVPLDADGLLPLEDGRNYEYLSNVINICVRATRM